MSKTPNLRIEVSPEARRILDFEVALTGESLATCASNAIKIGVSKKAVELAETTISKPKSKRSKLVTSTVKLDTPTRSLLTTNKVPIKKDAEAMRYIDEHMNTDRGTSIAAAIGRSVSSVNKYIKAKRDGSV